MAATVERHDLDRLAEKVVRSHLSVPAVFLLELGKPLAFLGSQMLLLWGPIAHLVVDPRRYDRFAEGMSSRENWEALIVRIEQLERGDRGEETHHGATEITEQQFIGDSGSDPESPKKP